MSQEKKVLFLLLSLIVLIVLCVYNHLETIEKSQVPVVEDKIESQIDTKEEDTSASKNEKIEQSEETAIQENTETKENPDTTSSEEGVKEESSVSEEIKEEPVVEVEEKPLVTTGEKYIRQGSEKRIEELSKEAQLLQIKMSAYIKENPIIFRRGSNKITKKSNTSIKTIVKALKEFPNIKVEIAGHTDAAGPNKINQAVSLERAKSVFRRLVYYGIDKNRLIVRGYGEDIPLVKNSPKGYSVINRRVEFNIVEE